MATLVTEIYGWLLCNRTTFIHSSAFVGLLNIIRLINACDMERIKLFKNNFTEMQVGISSEC